VHKKEGAGATSEELEKLKKQNISLRCMIEDLQSLVDRLQKEKQDILTIKKVVKETSVLP
jgi:hypothetical protein